MEPNQKIIDVVDVQAGEFRERPMTEAELAYDPFEFLEVAGAGGRVRRSLREALVLSPDAGNMLRDGIRFIAFSTFAELPQVWAQLANQQASNKPEEYYLRDAAIGRLNRVRSGQPTPRITSSFEGNAVIPNHMYRAIVEVLGDDIRFDRLGKIRQTAQLMARSARATEDAETISVVTTTANYSRSNTAGDNDVQANYQAAYALTHANFEDAMATIATAKDRKSGQYLGLMADTILVGPRMEWQVRKLLTSDRMQGAGGADATERGDLNTYRGAIRRIIVNPMFSNSYDWALFDSTVDSLYYQQVEPFNVYQTTMTPDNSAWLNRDVIEYLVTDYFGVGFVDDRPWFYAVNSTRPTL